MEGIILEYLVWSAKNVGGPHYIAPGATPRIVSCLIDTFLGFGSKRSACLIQFSAHQMAANHGLNPHTLISYMRRLTDYYSRRVFKS